MCLGYLPNNIFLTLETEVHSLYVESIHQQKKSVHKKLFLSNTTQMEMAIDLSRVGST